MIPYIILLLVVIASLFLPRKQQGVAYVIILLIMLFLGYFRADTVGTDVLFSHEPSFKDASYSDYYMPNVFGFEPGFMFIMAAWKDLISKEYMPFFGLCFVFTTLSIFWFYKRNSINPIFTVFLYILYCLFFNSMNLIRQFFCISIILFAVDYYLKKGKIGVYIPIVLVCSVLLHISSLMFLLVPLIDKIRLKNSLLIKMFLTLVFFISLLSFYFRDFVISRFELLAEYEALSKIESYTSGSNMDDTTNNVTAIMESLFCLILIWMSDKGRYISFFLKSFLFGCILYNVLSCFSVHTWRIGLPYLLVGLTSVSDIWGKTKGIKGLLVRSSIILFFAGYFVRLAIIGEVAGVFPYESRLSFF